MKMKLGVLLVLGIGAHVALGASPRAHLSTPFSKAPAIASRRRAISRMSSKLKTDAEGSAVATLEAPMKGPAARWFEEMDRDGDGTISAAEFLVGYDRLEDELSPPARQSIALAAERMITGLAYSIVSNDEASQQRTVQKSLNRLKGDLDDLDFRAGENLKLTETEILVLTAMTFISFTSPIFFTERVVEVLIPSMAALAAALGLTFEYVGKVAVSGGKEVAATAMQAAAEAEAQLAAAERTKAVLPLCAGVSASASAFALLAPALLEHLMPNAAVLVSAEYFLLCPAVSILAAAIAALAAEDTAALCDRAKSIGERRFASRADVSNTWMSVTDRVSKDGLTDRKRWISFAISVLPAPFFATLMPGGIGEKAVLAAATAAAQAAFHLAKAEYTLAIATDAVAVKARIAAVADTYANQGARAGALLPFTSALAGLCVAGAAFIVEFNPLVASAFPALASVFAAAASVAKARCEIDFAATNAAADELAFRSSPGGGREQDFLEPINSVRKLISTVARSIWTGTKQKVSTLLRNLSRLLGSGPPPRTQALAV
ncbi:hypothetical protein T492DRAFT_977734 [Pavlovales sp. CCMP2436]|nr:hypothetical protein T492DRAFT_977734 [Pavlovales sp. CCMP2436]